MYFLVSRSFQAWFRKNSFFILDSTVLSASNRPWVVVTLARLDIRMVYLPYMAKTKLDIGEAGYPSVARLNDETLLRDTSYGIK